MNPPHDFGLKCWPEFFRAVKDGTKNFELRRNDRGFFVGAILRIDEWCPEHGYTGDHVYRVVTYLLEGPCPWGLRSGFCILSLAPLSEPMASTERTKP